MAAASSKGSSSPISPATLTDLEIPGATGPLPSPPAAPDETLWGINHKAVLDEFPQHGLQVYVSNWSQMSAGDTVSVMLDQTTVATSKTIAPEEVNQRVTLFVEAICLTPGHHTLHYSVARFDQPPQLSAQTHIFVKLDQPGAGDCDLHLSLPAQIVDDGVDADLAKAGVPVTIAPYSNMATGDQIELAWGGEFVYHSVTAMEVGTEIVITVGESTILAAGDSYGVPVTVAAHDLVQNRCENRTAEVRVAVKAGGSQLLFPLIKEAAEDVLDLDALGRAPVTAQVWARAGAATREELTAFLGEEYTARIAASTAKDRIAELLALKSGFAHGDKIVARLTGTTVTGDTTCYEASEVVVDNLPHVYEIALPNFAVRHLVQAVFCYRLIHEDGSEDTSQRAFVRVARKTLHMAAPIALSAIQDALDPYQISTQVEVPWHHDMAAGDRITLKWRGTRPDFTIYDPVLAPHHITHGEATWQRPIVMTIPGAYLKVIEGGTLELYYLLETEFESTIIAYQSEHTSILRVGDPHPELPAPDVFDVVDGRLEGLMNSAMADATLTVPNYARKALGDEVHYLWKGSQTGDTTDWITVNSFTFPVPINFTIAASLIAPNDGGTVEACYWVIRKTDGRRSDSDVVAFSVAQPIVLDPPTICSVKDEDENEIPNGGSTARTRVIVTGNAAASQEVEVFDGDITQGNATADIDGAWMKSLIGLTNSVHAIKAVAQYGSGAVSAVHEFKVTAVSAVGITRVEDSNAAPLSNNATTTDTTVNVFGTVSWA